MWLCLANGKCLVIHGRPHAPKEGESSLVVTWKGSAVCEWAEEWVGLRETKRLTTDSQYISKSFTHDYVQNQNPNPTTPNSDHTADGLNTQLTTYTNGLSGTPLIRHSICSGWD